MAKERRLESYFYAGNKSSFLESGVHPLIDGAAVVFKDATHFLFAPPDESAVERSLLQAADEELTVNVWSADADSGAVSSQTAGTDREHKEEYVPPIVSPQIDYEMPQMEPMMMPMSAPPPQPEEPVTPAPPPPAEPAEPALSALDQRWQSRLSECVNNERFAALAQATGAQMNEFARLRKRLLITLTVNESEQVRLREEPLGLLNARFRHFANILSRQRDTYHKYDIFWLVLDILCDSAL